MTYAVDPLVSCERLNKAKLPRRIRLRDRRLQSSAEFLWVAETSSLAFSQAHEKIKKMRLTSSSSLSTDILNGILSVAILHA